MKKNKCIRCEKTERLGRVFESVEYNGNEFHLCIECAQLLYKAADAQRENNAAKAVELREEFKDGITNDKGKDTLLSWMLSAPGNEN